MATERWMVKRGPWPNHGVGQDAGESTFGFDTPVGLPPGCDPKGAVAHAAQKIEAGERLNFDDGVALFRTHEVTALAWLANRVRESMHGDKAWFNRNMHLNPTNVCVETCRFCAYARRRIEADGAWRMTLDQAMERVRSLGKPPKTEVHIVGGCDPELPFEFYTELLAQIRSEAPHLHIKAFTAVEIDHFAGQTGWDHGRVLDALIEAGLGSLPGGGVEIFSQRARDLLSVRKGSAETWLSVHSAAHERGLFTNATMLFGHIESLEERVDHLLHLRRAQDADAHLPGRFRTFVPLAFHPDNSGLRMLPAPTGLDALRTYAVSRLMLDNIEHIKCYWVQVGIGIAQTALWWGADDIDGTIAEERIYHMAGSTVPGALTRDELVRTIEQAGRRPVERDTLYSVVEEAQPGEVSP